VSTGLSLEPEHRNKNIRTQTRRSQSGIDGVESIYARDSDLSTPLPDLKSFTS
jgi:hypothetical protein